MSGYFTSVSSAGFFWARIGIGVIRTDVNDFNVRTCQRLLDPPERFQRILRIGCGPRRA